MEETGNEGRKERREGGTGWRRDEGKQAEDGVAGALSGPAWERRRKTAGGSAVFSLKGRGGSVSLRVLRQPRTAVSALNSTLTSSGHTD